MKRLWVVITCAGVVLACRSWNAIHSVAELAEAEGACRRGDQLACGAVSSDLIAGSHYSRAWPLALIACDAGAPLGCSTLGVFFDKGHPPAPKHRELAILHYRFACEHGVDWACADCGLALLHSGDYPAAAEMLQRSCDAGVLLGCVNYGHLIGEVWTERRDRVEARRVLERACDAGSVPACRRVGALLLDGLGGPGDRDAGLAMLEHTCYQRDARGCFFAGLALMDAGLTDRAVRFLRRGCASGEGCEQLARALFDADGGPEYYELLDAADRACKADEPGGCAILARLFLRVGNVEGALSRARSACRRGAADACSLLAEVDAGL